MRVTDLSKVVCLIDIDGDSGSGIWLGDNRILTALHVISKAFENEDLTIEVTFKELENNLVYLFEGEFVSGMVERDVAIISLKPLPEDKLPADEGELKYTNNLDEFNNLIGSSELFIEEVTLGSACDSFGYPSWSSLGGALVSGTITSESINMTKWNVAIKQDDKEKKKFDGMSGSPVLVNQRIVGILIIQNDKYLNYVSFTKIAGFLVDNGIPVINLLSNRGDYIPLNNHEKELTEENVNNLKEVLGSNCVLFVGEKFNELAENFSLKDFENNLIEKVYQLNANDIDKDFTHYLDRLNELKISLNGQLSVGFFDELARNFFLEQKSEVTESHRKLIKIPNGGVFYFYYDLTLAKALMEENPKTSMLLSDYYTNLLQERLNLSKLHSNSKIIHVLGAASSNSKIYNIALTNDDFKTQLSTQWEYIEKILWAILTTKTCVLIGFKKPLPRFLKSLLSIVCTETNNWNKPRHFYISETNGESYIPSAELSLLGLTPIYIETPPENPSSNVELETFISSLISLSKGSPVLEEKSEEETIEEIFEGLMNKSKK